MATKSISKNIVIKDNKTAKKLVNALEQAEAKEEPKSQSNVSYSYASNNEIKSMFCVSEK